MTLIGEGYIKSARSMMRTNRWRSFLTMLGVIVGVSSVITVVGIGEGVKQQVSQQINTYSKNVITVRPASVADNASDNPLRALDKFSLSGSLTTKDVGQIAKLRHVSTVVPLTVATGAVKGDNPDSNAFVVGTSTDLPMVLNQSLAYGVFFTADDYGSNVAVLGADVAQRLFNQDVPLGRSFTIRGQQYVVRGVLNAFAATPFSTDANFNDAVFIPSNNAASLAHGTTSMYEILVKIDSGANLNSVAKSINGSLLANHGGEQDFKVLKPSDTVTNTNNVLTLLTELIGGVAAISLLVGGIGIMNVMLVSVTERMHEIGIRKAVGATNRQILQQFIVEASVLSVTGCIIGVVISFVIDIVLRLTTTLTPAISWQVVLLAVAVSLVIGVIFGSAPALKAARKDPIAALRNE